MKQRIALAYSGSLASSAALAWLRERHDAAVVAVTLDVGQSDDLDDVRSRALAGGALRAHVVDAREVFAQNYAVPALRTGVAGMALHELADPLIARALVDVAQIEAADAVAHAASSDERGAQLSGQIAVLDPSLRVLAPAHEWTMDAAQLAAFSRERGLPVVAGRPESNLLIRSASDPARAPEGAAHLDLDFAGGLPVAINGVTMTPAELIESLSLIGGQYGLGFGEVTPSPAAIILGAAFRDAASGNDSVRVTLERGSYRVTAVRTHDSQLVNHP
jgi:argininosuccinate synthase